MRAAILVGVMLACTMTLQAGYRIESVPLPSRLRGGISGVTFTPAGSLVLATRYGEIWIRKAPAGEWTRFARGLNEPMGVVAESETAIAVAHRPELVRLSDLDGDGEAETFDVLADDWGLTNNYHEFFFGLRRDGAGNYYGALSLGSSGEKKPLGLTRGRVDGVPSAEKAGHKSEVPYRGWAVRVTPRGEVQRFATGFRQPNGVGLSPENELFVTDNQGDYKAACGLLHVARGDFHGHAEGLKWDDGFVPGSLTREKLWQRFKPPAVVFPQGVLGVSSGEPAWDLTAGRFGAFAGQIFVADHSGLVVRSEIEHVAGEYQGAAFPFTSSRQGRPNVTGERLAQGGMRLAFAPDGSLYIGQTTGWGAGADGLQRIVWDGQSSADLQHLSLTAEGFALTFTEAMDPVTLANPANYRLTRHRYFYQSKYGSRRVDESPVSISAVRVGEGSRRVELVVAGLAAGFVYELAVPDLRDARGKPLDNPAACYTANRLRNGEIATGGTTRLERPDDSTARGPTARNAKSTTEIVPIDGKSLYTLYCVACHQPDGRGVAGGAADFVNNKAHLTKPDAELLKVIADGIEAKGMPPFKTLLSGDQQRAVLAFLRQAFGGAREPVTPRSR